MTAENDVAEAESPVEVEELPSFKEVVARFHRDGWDSHWYAIRTAPGSQQMAKANEAEPGANETEDHRILRERRIGESIIERRLRNAGLDVYMPAYWHEIIHHRTNKIIERRLPLMVGYAFVHLPDLAFEKVREVDGVVCFLRSSRDFGPVRFRATDLAVIASEEHSRRQQFRMDRYTRMENEKSGKIMSLRTSIRKHMKKGRSTRVNLKEQAMMAIQTMEEGARETVMAMLQQLEALEGEDTLALIDRVA